MLVPTQAVWLKEANAGQTGGFPASAETLHEALRWWYTRHG
jgi:hypothetical protein